MHTGHRKRYRYQGAPPPPTAATNAQSPRTAQPPSSAWQAPCVYMYLLGEGGDIGERWHNANMEPAKYLCLHNTRGETGQASCCKKMLHSHRGVARNASLLFECFLPHREKRVKGGCRNWLSIDSESRLQWRQGAGKKLKCEMVVDFHGCSGLINTRGYTGENSKGC